jgi:hypothetical protein
MKLALMDDDGREIASWDAIEQSLFDYDPNNLETLKRGGPPTVVENALVREIAEEIAIHLHERAGP